MTEESKNNGNKNGISFAEYVNRKNNDGNAPIIIEDDASFGHDFCYLDAPKFGTGLGKQDISEFARKAADLVIEQLKQKTGQHPDGDTDTGIFRIYPEIKSERKIIKEVLKDVKPTDYQLGNDSDTETFRTLVDVEKGNL